MALACAQAVSLAGLDGQLVEVQCDIAAGLPGLYFTGLPDASVSESRDRLRAAVQNTGVEWPNRRITVALLPADVRKVGSRFDLAVCLAVLGAAGQVPPEAVRTAVWLAELGLDGRLRPVRGVLPSVLAARNAGVRRVVVATANAAEAALVDGVDIRAADHLGEIVGWLTGEGPALDVAVPARPTSTGARQPDLADVAGQHVAKRAVEVAAAGGHHVFLLGVPGAGKTMLAERMPGLLPALTDAEALEVTAVHSVAGLLGARAELVRRPPLQAPHHTASIAALVGGGSYLARPGAISLAHRGVLFLDEAHEFSPACPRRPAPAARVGQRRPAPRRRCRPVPGAVPARAGGEPVRVHPAARRMRVRAAGAAPAPAAAVRTAARPRRSPGTGRRRRARRPVRRRAAGDDGAGGDTGRGRPRPRAGTVERQPVPHQRRGAGIGPALRAVAPARCTPPRELDGYLQQGRLSARGYDRVLRLAWTLADLADRAAPEAADVAEALYFRTGQVGACAA